MSMPYPQTYTGYYTRKKSYDNGTSESGTFSTAVIKTASNRAISPKVAIPPRIKTYTYRGRTYDRLAGWVYPPKKPKVAPNTWRPPKPYSAFLKSGDVTAVNCSIATTGSYYDEAHNRYGTWRQFIVGEYPVGSVNELPAVPSFDGGLESRAIVKALSRLKEQSVNLAVAFAERAETTELLVGTLHGLAKAARSLRQGNLAGVMKGLGLRGSTKMPRGQNFHQKWLELQYGWQPLYSDVFGAVQALHAADQNDKQRYAATVKAQVQNNGSINRSGTHESQPTVKCTSAVQWMEGASVSLSYYLRNPLIASLASLGITNPIEVLWERVPFSFVVDWFLPIGNYLSSMDAAYGFDFRGGSCTRIYRQTLLGRLGDGSPYAGSYPAGTYGTVNSRSVTMNRKVYEDSPLPRIPSLKNPFPPGSTHIANAIALFASSLRA